MLPATPVQHLLLAAVGRPLVMTSGNITDDPLVSEDAEAARDLGELNGQPHVLDGSVGGVLVVHDIVVGDHLRVVWEIASGAAAVPGPLAACSPRRLARRGLDLSRAYLSVSCPATGGRGEGVVRGLGAFFVLLRRGVVELTRGGGLRPLVSALQRRSVTVAGVSYRGVEAQAVTTEQAEGLLPVTHDQIVGNDEYLEAGLRLARDVAAFDVSAGTNPKKVNPVLFGLGSPGCGKTVTAHAIGRYFLDYCRERSVPASFHVVRRTDWASSYQNASAMNLVSLFRDQVHGSEGVAGVYWPDIDTAFASRSSSDLRMEEKQNLGAVFGVFDGTLLPKDGKWFLICDANTIRMDAATVSRIAQNPYSVAGPTTVEHYVTLIRDVLLRDVAPWTQQEGEGWARIGERALALGLSGRNVEAACGNMRAAVQDFELPDEYFRASPERRQEIVRGLYRPLSSDQIIAALEELARFTAESEALADQERFDQEVDDLVRHLNASRAARARAVTGGEP